MSRPYRPFVNDLVELSSKGSLAYTTHPYHTKVPPEILQRLIEHYTLPGETVLDTFCGSGMAGLAAVRTRRSAILLDLSPYACHIAGGFTRVVDLEMLEKSASAVVTKAREEAARYYITGCRSCRFPVEISYAIWSDLARCPNCGAELVVWDVAVDPKNGEVMPLFDCPQCNFRTTKGQLIRKYPVPVRLVYKCVRERKTQEYPPTVEDTKLVNHPDFEKYITDSKNETMMHSKIGEPWGEQWRSGSHEGVSRISDFFTRRNYHVLNVLWTHINEIDDNLVRGALQFAFTASIFGSSKMVRYIPSRGGRSNVPATLYIPPIFLEQNVLFVLQRRLSKVIRLKRHLSQLTRQTTLVQEPQSRIVIGVGEAQDLSHLPNDYVHYFVIDPPFGENIQYGELNFIPESWLGTHTDVTREAVINRFRDQDVERYLGMMERSFRELHRVLKPERFGTVIFNSASPQLWFGVKAALLRAGFSIESVTCMVKGHGGWNQVVHSKYTTRYDPLIHVLKTTRKQSVRFNEPKNVSQTERQIVDMVRKHLEDLDERAPNYLRSLPYVHGLVVRDLLRFEDLTRPPSPRELESVLEKHHIECKGSLLDLN